MIENQVYLAQGAYAKVVGRSAGILEICERLHYNLVALYIQIQVAASWEKLGKSVMARNLLQKSLEQAMPTFQISANGYLTMHKQNLYKYMLKI